MPRNVIFNVLVKGNSIGMTFNIKEAQRWARDSVNTHAAVIVPVRYRDPNTNNEE